MKQTLLIITLLLLISCGSENSKIVTLKTDLPEVISFVNAFNSSNNKIKILIETKEGSSGDIVIYRGQSGSKSLETKEISYLFEGKIDRDNFYSDIINGVIHQDGSCYLLPLTFNLNGLIYNRDEVIHQRDIDIEDFLDQKDLIFSPFWQREFILWYYLSSRPELTSENKFFDKKEFKQSANRVLNTITNRDKEWDILQFNEKYLYQSPKRLVKDSIIDYYYYSLTDYLAIDKKYYNNISFSLLSRNGVIPADDMMIYIGVDSQTKLSKECDEILAWFFNPENQSNFIKNNRKNLDLYPLFNGELSTLKEVTSELLTTYYPELKLLIPETEIITANQNLPELWDSLKSEVYMPLFSEIETTPDTEWEKKQNEFYTEWYKKHNK